MSKLSEQQQKSPYDNTGEGQRPPLLKEKHKKARLMFGKTFIDKPQSLWDSLWTDETNVEVFEDAVYYFLYRQLN